MSHQIHNPRTPKSLVAGRQAERVLVRKSIPPARSLRDRLTYRKIRLAIASIDGAAKKMGVTEQEMYNRLKEQNLIHNRLLAEYDLLHTQSEKWVIDDTIEALQSWEAGV